MKKKKTNGQATIEMIMIFPFLIFFVLLMFFSGLAIYRQIAAWNINYSAGMTMTKIPYGEGLPTETMQKAIQGNSGMNGTTNSVNYFGYIAASGGKMFRGVSVQTTTPPVLSNYGVINDYLYNFYSPYSGSPSAAAVYPVSPWLSYGKK